MTAPLDPGSRAPPEPDAPDHAATVGRTGADRRAAAIDRMRREIPVTTIGRLSAPLVASAGRIRRDLARRFARDRRAAMLARAAPATRSLPLFGLLVGVAVLAAGVAALQWIRAPRPHPEQITAPAPNAPPAAERQPPISNERQIAIGRLSRLRADPIAPFDPAAPSATEFETSFGLAPPYETIDSALFDTVDRRLRLARILPVGRDQVCRDDQGRRFACGLQARAALQNAISRRSVACRRLFLPSTTLAEAPIPVDCRVGDGDLAELLVRLGHAFAGPLAGEGLLAAQADARARRVGVWSGDVAPPERDPALDDARAVPFAVGRLAASPPPALIHVDEPPPPAANPPNDLRPTASPRPEPTRPSSGSPKPARRPTPAGAANP